MTMAQYNWRTCPADVQGQAQRLLGAFRALLGADLVGIYLHGSLAMGCFNPLRSDIDLLAVTQEPITVEIKAEIARLLLEVSRRPTPVEISFLASRDLTPWRHPTPFDFHYSEDWRPAMTRDLAQSAWGNCGAVRRCDADLAGHITVTRHRGICLYGLPIPQVFPVVPRTDFLASILADVLDQKYGLTSDLSHPVYVILNACRTLAYLRTGQILSKDEGGGWAAHILPERYGPTLVALSDAYRSCGDEGGVPAAAVADLVACLREEIMELI
jgi:predicted nucleotidyltransferase